MILTISIHVLVRNEDGVGFWTAVLNTPDLLICQVVIPFHELDRLVWISRRGGGKQMVNIKSENDRKEEDDERPGNGMWRKGDTHFLGHNGMVNKNTIHFFKNLHSYPPA